MEAQKVIKTTLMCDQMWRRMRDVRPLRSDDGRPGSGNRSTRLRASAKSDSDKVASNRTDVAKVSTELHNGRHVNSTGESSHGD